MYSGLQTKHFPTIIFSFECAEKRTKILIFCKWLPALRIHNHVFSWKGLWFTPQIWPDFILCHKFSHAIWIRIEHKSGWTILGKTPSMTAGNINIWSAFSSVFFSGFFGVFFFHIPFLIWRLGRKEQLSIWQWYLLSLLVFFLTFLSLSHL